MWLHASSTLPQSQFTQPNPYPNGTSTANNIFSTYCSFLGRIITTNTSSLHRHWFERLEPHQFLLIDNKYYYPKFTDFLERIYKQAEERNISIHPLMKWCMHQKPSISSHRSSLKHMHRLVVIAPCRTTRPWWDCCLGSWTALSSTLNFLSEV